DAPPDDGGLSALRRRYGPLRAHGASPDVVLDTLCSVMADAGAAVAEFVRAGYCRYSSHIDNFEFCLAEDRLYLTDFDTCRSSVALGEEERALQLLRDAMSGVWNLGCTLVEPGNAAWTAAASIPALASPFGAFLRGFFGLWG